MISTLPTLKKVREAIHRATQQDVSGCADALDALNNIIRQMEQQAPVIECDCTTEISPCGDKKTTCGSGQMRRAAMQGHAFRTASPQPAAVQEPVQFLANGTRFKMSFFQNEDSYGNCIVGTHVTCFEAFEKELDGRWVALVAAEDDCHRHLIAPSQPAAQDLIPPDVLFVAPQMGNCVTRVTTQPQPGAPEPIGCGPAVVNRQTPSDRELADGAFYPQITGYTPASTEKKSQSMLAFDAACYGGDWPAKRPAAQEGSKLAPVEPTAADPAIYYMRDNHTFRRLSDDASVALVEIEAEFNAGYTHGSLCSKREGFESIHAHGSQSRMQFLSDCKKALEAVLAAPQVAPEQQATKLNEAVARLLARLDEKWDEARAALGPEKASGIFHHLANSIYAVRDAAAMLAAAPKAEKRESLTDEIDADAAKLNDIRTALCAIGPDDRKEQR